MDLTTGELARVSWPGYPPLYVVDGFKVYQIRFWAHNEQSWVTLGAQTAKIQVQGNLERTVQDHFKELLSRGVPF